MNDILRTDSAESPATLVKPALKTANEKPAETAPYKGQDASQPQPVPENVIELIKDALSLIAYLSAKGDGSQAETTSAIYLAQRAVERKAWTDDLNSKFFAALAELSRKAQPVTPQTLRDSENASVKRVVNRWSWGVFILLPTLVALSSLSYANGQFVTNAEKWLKYSNVIESPKPSYPSLDDLPPNGIAPKSATSGVAPDPTAPPPDRRAEDIEDHNGLLEQTVAQMLAHQIILTNFTRYRLISSRDTFLPMPDVGSRAAGADKSAVESANETKEKARDRERILTGILRVVRVNLNIVLTVDKTFYGVLSTYVLPLLCALLGATAYGLRTLSAQTEAKIYRASYVPYARTISAVIVGFAVGLFSDFTAKLTLQPLATAFIAGYGVEAFFIFLDTLLQAVQKPRT